MIKPGKMIAEVVRHLFKKPATVNYPAEKAVLPPEFRGKITFYPEKCVGCKLCEKDCPAFAIQINKVGEKRFEAEFELDRCIYCGQCVLSCNRDALESTPEFELAQLSREKLKVIYHAKPAAAQPANQSDLQKKPE